MNKDDKYRVIGKIIAISSDRFTVELLAGTGNFNINGFDDIHSFAQVNSYVILPYQNYHIVAEVISVRERDTGITYPNNPIEQVLSKNNSVKYLEIIPIGTIKIQEKESKFEFGVSVYPALYSDVLYIKKAELDCIFKVKDEEKVCTSADGTTYTKLKSLSIGSSTIFEGYDIKIDIDKFFGAHSAILGNTGSGKSCTISSILQNIYTKKAYGATGSTFFFFDVNGEYQQAFSQISKQNPEISTKYYSIDVEQGKGLSKKFILPHWFLSFEEWALLLNASEKTQLPILRNALGLATLFSNNDQEQKTKETKNHILAACVITCFESSDSPVAKYQRIKSLVTKGYFEEDILRGYSSVYGNLTQEAEAHFLSTIKGHIKQEGFEIPTYNNTYFPFNLLEECLDIAILFEEAHGNKQIRDYCSSLLTRFKSLRDREDYKFLRIDDSQEDISNYIFDILGITHTKEGFKKEQQIIILDLNSCEDEVVEIISCVISRLLFEKLTIAKPRNIFPINLVLEEAHRYISTTQERTFLKANHIFERIAKEGRKYGMFLLISSQRPSELSRTVLSQCSNFIVHRIQNPEDLSHIRQITPHISETILKRMPSIPTQHALVFGQAVNLPAIFKVKNADPLPNSANNQISTNWFRDNKDSIKISFE